MTIKWQILLLSFIFILTGCGLASSEVPTPRPPTITPTRISTPLPYIETPLPAGFNTNNPIEIVVVPSDASVANQRLSEFESALQALTDVTISVTLLDDLDDAYNAVCNSETGVVSAALLDGMSYIANNFAGCGIAGLQQNTPDGTGRPGVLLLNREFQEDGIPSINEATVCRLDVDDLFSWSVPLLLYATEGIAPGDLQDISESVDNDDLIADLEAGRCAAGGMAQADWQAYLEADEDGSLAENVYVAATSPDIPYNVFSFSSSLSLDAINDIRSGLRRMEILAGRSQPTAQESEEEVSASPDVDTDLMVAFFGEGELVTANNNDFIDLFDLFAETGVAFSELR